MKATFTYAVIYEVTATCLTPLRTGDGDIETVLRNGRHQAIIQGASIAGALRGDGKQMEELFGSRERGGHLIVSDGVFDSSAQVQLRPRLRMDGATGTGANGGKFDVAHIGRSATFGFTLTWLGEKDLENELRQLEGLLGALHCGEITLGAQKTNGFGRVSLAVEKAVFNLKDATMRQSWLSGNWQGKALALPEVSQSQKMTFTVVGQADNILIKASAPIKVGSSSYTPNLAEGGVPVLPGSSVKGAVRGQVTAIAKTLGMTTVVEKMFGTSGDKGTPGVVRVEDVLLEKHPQKISRIRINRFTGGVMRGGLFTEEPLSSPVTIKLSLPEKEGVACGLLLYALRDLGQGRYNLGSGGSVGRGYIKVSEIRAKAPDGREAVLQFTPKGECTIVGNGDLFEQWLQQVEEGKANG